MCQETCQEKSLPDLLGEVTGLLKEWTCGDAEALRDLIPRVYSELRGMAERLSRGKRRRQFVQPTILVNELYMRLAEKTRTETLDFPTRVHFYAFAGTLMRRVLVDLIRRESVRDNGGENVSLEFDESHDLTCHEAVDRLTLLSLHRALQKLALLDARQARIVEYKYFAGLTVEEIVHLVGISRATVNRELQTARVLLAREMGRSQEEAV